MKKRVNFPRQVWICFVSVVVNGNKFCIVLVFFKGGKFSFRPSLEHGKKLLLFFCRSKSSASQASIVNGRARVTKIGFTPDVN